MNIPGGLGVVGTKDYEENRRNQKAKSEDKISEYLKYLETVKQHEYADKKGY